LWVAFFTPYFIIPMIQCSACGILATGLSGRILIKDFCPLSYGIKWLLGQAYFRDRGNCAFIKKAEVPWVVNYYGSFSTEAVSQLVDTLNASSQCPSKLPQE
jgi:hypothetical protein